MAKNKGSKARKVNIGGNENDAFHRYKREEIQVKKEALATIVNAYAKTTMINIPQISEDIDRPITLLSKFFGTELGTQSRFDKSTKNLVLNGQHTVDDLEKMLNNFIAIYVLCESCNNPETDIVVTKEKNATLECIACGHTTVLDPKHKLVNYIARNPPKNNKKAKGKARERSSTTNNEEPTATVVVKGDETWTPQIDTSEEAVKSRLQQEGVGNTAVQQLTMQAAKDKLPHHPVAHLKYALGRNVDDEPEDVDASNEDIMKLISSIKSDFKLDRGDCICMLFDTIVSPSNWNTIFAKRADLFKSYIRNMKESRIFIRCIEYLVHDHQDKLLTKVGQILNAVYENDIIDNNEHFMEWFDSKQSKSNRKFNVTIAGMAKPFIDWLAQDDTDSEEDETDSDEDSDDDE